jgi:hypothetical protein
MCQNFIAPGCFTQHNHSVQTANAPATVWGSQVGPRRAQVKLAGWMASWIELQPVILSEGIRTGPGQPDALLSNYSAPKLLKASPNN